MSNLKHKKLPELLADRRYCENRIKYYGSRKAGQEEKLKWINIYIAEKENE